jgi:hypothetical protein
MRNLESSFPGSRALLSDSVFGRRCEFFAVMYSCSILPGEFVKIEYDTVLTRVC